MILIDFAGENNGRDIYLVRNKYWKHQKSFYGWDHRCNIQSQSHIFTKQMISNLKFEMLK